MRTFSEELREAREKKGLTLEDLAVSTKITLNILKAMESGNFDVLPQTYIKGFLKTYAREVGLDEGSLVAAYDAQLKQAAEVFLRPQRTEKRSRRKIPWVRVGGVVAAVLLCVVAYYLVREWEPQSARDPEPRQSSHAAFIEDDSVVSAVDDDSIVTALEQADSAGLSVVSGGEPGEKSDTTTEHGDEPDRSATPETTAAGPELSKPAVTDLLPERTAYQTSSEPFGPPAPPAPDKLTLEAEAVSDTWMRVEAAGERLYEGILRAGSKRRWQTDGPFELKIGRAAGVRLFLNGQSLGELGTADQVVSELVLNREGIVRKILR